MKLFGTIASLLIAVPQTALGAGNADTLQGTATATVVAPIALNHVAGRSLSFGRFTVGGAGTVVVTPAGARTTTGGITPVSGGTVAADAFRVTGEPNRSYSIATASSTLTAPGGASLTFTTTPSARPARCARAVDQTLRWAGR